MKKILLSIIFSALTMCLPLCGQTLTVQSFMANYSDITARTSEGMRRDILGDTCALIKVILVEPNVTFESNDIVEASPQIYNNQYMVYMVEGTKKLKINAPHYLPLEVRFSDYDSTIVALKPMTTYVLTIVSDPNAPTTQFLQFKIDPAESMLEVDGEPWPVQKDGSSTKRVKFGNHSYKVTMPDYHTVEDTVAVFDADNRTIRPVKLRPAFGWVDVDIDVDSKDAGLNLYIDSKLVGNSAIRHLQLPSGQHTLHVASQLYQAYSEQFEVRDSLTTTLRTHLNSDYAQATFTVAEEAEIWINGEKMGTSTWSGALPSGEYRVETKLPNRESTLRLVRISPDIPTNLELAPPGYYYGALSIEGQPIDTQILVDGVSKGTTPKVCYNLPSGTHQLMLKKDGYEDKIMTVNVDRDKTSEIQYNLVPETVSSPQTPTPIKTEEASSSFYLQGGYQVGSLSGLGINVGGYFNHVNAEIGLTMGLSAINETYDGYNQIECKPMAFGAKVGYGLDVAKGFRLTPQVGLSLVSISGTQSVGQKSKDLKCYALPGTLSLRADYAFNSHVGINLTPQLNVALSKSATFDQLANQISQIKGLGTGFGLSIGIFVQF